MNFYKRHIGDYLKDTAHLSLLEHGVYGRLIDVYYTREAGIPDEQAARLIGARSKDECAALKSVLKEFFELVDGLWLQARCEREIGDALVKIEANRNNGKKGGRPKAKANPNANPEQTQEKPGGFQLGSDSLTQKNLSHKPLAISHKKEEAAHTAVLPPTPEDACNALPEFPSSLGLEQKAAVPLVVKLRALGVTITSANPLAAEWLAKGLTVERADEAVEFARLKGKPAGPIHPNFLNALIDDVLKPKAPPKPRDDWYRSDAGITRKASELGLMARGGETYANLRERCESEIRKRSQGAAA